MNEQLQRTNTSGRLLLSGYPAIVENVEHPDKLYLVQIRLMSLWDGISPDDLPWAEFLLPIGAKPNAGHGVPVEVGDRVWVDFPRGGDTRFPRITGSIYHAPDMVSHLPGELFEREPYEQKRHADEPPAPPYSMKDDIYQRFGFMEQKTHTGGWCVTHRATGTAIEITDKGAVVIHSETDAFRSSVKNTTENVGGDLLIKVVGNATVECASATLKASGSTMVDSGGDITLKSGGSVNIEASGPFSVKATNADMKLG